MTAATLISYEGTLTREQLALIPTPPGTATHKPLPHHEVAKAMVDTLGLYKIGITKEQYAVSKDGMKFYFTYDLATGFPGGNFTIGGRSSNDKSLAFQLVAGYRVFVCQNGSLDGDYTSVMKKHTKNVNLEEVLVVGINDIIKNYGPMVQEINRWKATQITDVTAKLGIYEAFMEYCPTLPRHMMRPTHDLYFNPQHEEFMDRTVWTLQNAFTGAAKVLDPIPQQHALVSIGEYFKQRKF